MSLPPVSPGSLMAESTSSTDFILEDALGEQMAADEQARDDADAASPSGLGGGEGGDEDDEEDDEVVYVPPPASTFDPSPYTAQQDFIRSASHFVSPMGYDIHTPSDWPGNATAETPIWNPYAPVGAPTVNAGFALTSYPGESVMDALNRQSAMAVSSMGYDEGMPNGPLGYAYPQGSIPSGTSAAMDMSDSTKRGRSTRPRQVPPPRGLFSSVSRRGLRHRCLPLLPARPRQCHRRPRFLHRTRRG